MVKGVKIKIISEFHDYYDVVQAMGQDQNMVYLRKQVKETYSIQNKYPFPVMGGSNWGWGRSLFVDQNIVGFCGKVYPVLEVGKGEIRATCFKLEEVDHFVDTHFRAKEIEEYRLKKKKYFRRRYWGSSWTRDDFEKFFAACAEQQNSFTQIFLDHNCPVFVAAYPHITYNGCLKPLQFFRVFDTFRAYQEIAMYFGGLAQPNRPIPEVSDKDMVTAKGFDKWSFRKEPKGK